MRKRLCVIVPAYNEAKVIRDVIKDSLALFKTSPYAIDILVVNDGSKDKTSDEARKGGAIVIDHILNSGAGGATATGLSYASQNSYDAAATMDADGQHSPKDILRGFDELFISGGDLLIGSRIIDTSIKDMSLLKRFGTRLFSIFTPFQLF